MTAVEIFEVGFHAVRDLSHVQEDVVVGLRDAGRGAVAGEGGDEEGQRRRDVAGRLDQEHRDRERDLCGIPTDSRYLQRECSGTNYWGLPL